MISSLQQKKDNKLINLASEEKNRLFLPFSLLIEARKDYTSDIPNTNMYVCKNYLRWYFFYSTGKASTCMDGWYTFYSLKEGIRRDIKESCVFSFGAFKTTVCLLFSYLCLLRHFVTPLLDYMTENVSSRGGGGWLLSFMDGYMLLSEGTWPT